MINNTIYIGSLTSPQYVLGDERLSAIASEVGDDLVSGTLSYDTLSIDATNSIAFRYGELIDSLDDLLTDSTDDLLLAKEGDYQDYDTIAYGTPVWWYYKTDLVGKFYVSSSERQGKYDYRIECVSAIGLLDRLPHVGGVYSGETFSAILATMLPSNISYTVVGGLSSTPIYGWLPYANGEEESARTNLQQLMLATGAAITKDASGNMVFGFLSESASTSSIDDAYVYSDGDSVTTDAPATDVEVIEHTFAIFDSDETVTLYDNTDGSGTSEQQTIVFDRAPCHSIEASGNLQIIESGVNYAIVSGMGVLTGKVYSHLQNVVTYQTGAVGAKSTASVDKATLVSIVNSQNVAQRVGSYYSTAKRIKSSFRLNGEKPNDKVTIRNAYDEVDTAIITRMSLDVSSFVKATAELVTGYSPTGQGNNYSTCTAYSSGATITVKKGDRIVLIGGGQGGQSGGNGEDGERGQIGNFGAGGGAGGVGGKGGTGGKVFAFTAPKGGTFSVTFGAGGSGGVQTEGSANEPVDGEKGGATTIAIAGVTYSSENGASTTLIRDFVNGVDYARTGLDGISGGAGGSPTAEKSGFGQAVVFNDVTYLGGLQGDPNRDGVECGGGGGGAAVGHDGITGAKGTVAPGGNGYTGGNGGSGGDADAPETQTHIDGRGGIGGNGSGGGGAGGPGVNALEVGAGGAAGLASNGQDGAQGCILVYSA